MLVCRTWRDVALASPELWRVLPPSIPRKVAALFLKRSCSVPICVFADGTALCAPEKPLYLKDPHRSRLKELYVLPTSPFWSFTIPHPLPPNLVFLELRRPTCVSCTEMRLSDYPIFGGCNPTLQALSINPRTVVPSDYFPGLAHLRLAGPRWFPIPISQLLRLLSNTPALETLYFTQTAIHDNDDDGLKTTDPVELPRLRVLSVEPRVSLRAAATFLSRLALPRQLNFQLHRLQIRRRTLPDGIYVPPMDSLTTLELIENDQRLHVRACGPSHGFWLHFVPGSGGFSLREEVLAPVLAKLVPALRDVTVLRVAAAPSYSSGFLDFALPHVLESCPLLTALVLAAPKSGVCDVVPAVVNALHCEALSPVLWLKLDCLGLQLGDPEADLLPLADMLAGRAQRDCRLRALTISKSSVDGRARILKDLEAVALEGHVDRVEVTGRVLWDVADDMLWKVENRWWPLYPRTEVDMRDGWGLHGIVG
ncbi:hypothetical protein L226DRAFT_609432 [Lentinus tigrinus ALCF2SS1-7]|uniref:F-box domain-containing protein n=1 Tax=Lentinus tigrinus ALCF2SS1-6 TaxID=1328759 RepID=A0A5C2ST45_9APHY|nr:hypothetical protein L227DRAFT_150284 [Lentinus tigrinus ALCF2SS1-6]RPD80564.1 hypothetical protein L226DRAFT_609432 [Lentinus tigrinus ALCF2SS1-7]